MAKGKLVPDRPAAKPQARAMRATPSTAGHKGTKAGYSSPSPPILDSQLADKRAVRATTAAQRRTKTEQSAAASSTTEVEPVENIATKHVSAARRRNRKSYSAPPVSHARPVHFEERKVNRSAVAQIARKSRSKSQIRSRVDISRNGISGERAVQSRLERGRPRHRASSTPGRAVRALSLSPSVGVASGSVTVGGEATFERSWSSIARDVSIPPEAHEVDERFAANVSNADIISNSPRDYLPHFEDNGSHMILVEYPTPGASEQFSLLGPKPRRRWNEWYFDPRKDLMTSLQLILKYYLTPEQAASVGYDPICPLRGPSTCAGSAGLEGSDSSGRRTTWSKIETGMQRRDLRMFKDGMQHFNKRIIELKRRPTRAPSSDAPICLSQIDKNVRNMNGLAHELVEHICEETYQRSGGLHVLELMQMRATDRNSTYGELGPHVITDMVHRTGLLPSSTFLDLGSGTGQTLLHSSLLSGCLSLGVENNSTYARISQELIHQGELRSLMWGVNQGRGIQVVYDDFTTNEQAFRWIREADVILYNNLVFSGSLNLEMQRKFLSCKEGAKIVTLDTFKYHQSRFKLSERNRKDLQAILEVEVFNYGGDSVSWAAKKGVYYIHTINRSELQKYCEKIRTA